MAGASETAATARTPRTLEISGNRTVYQAAEIWNIYGLKPNGTPNENTETTAGFTQLVSLRTALWNDHATLQIQNTCKLKQKLRLTTVLRSWSKKTCDAQAWQVHPVRCDLIRHMHNCASKLFLVGKKNKLSYLKVIPLPSSTSH